MHLNNVTNGGLKRWTHWCEKPAALHITPWGLDGRSLCSEMSLQPLLGGDGPERVKQGRYGQERFYFRKISAF